MPAATNLPFPVLDALPLGAHRLVALTDEALFGACGVRIAFTGREGGVSSGPYEALNCGGHVGDDPLAVSRNRRIVCAAVGASDVPLVVPRQVHGTNLAWASAGDEQPLADGVLSGEGGAAVMLAFADCLPLVIVSPTGRFAVVHVGWRGAVAHIAAGAVGELAHGDDAAPECYNAYIGPHIHAECFEVGADVEGAFVREFGKGASPAPRHVSLAGAVCADLKRAGLDPRRIVDAGICTHCNCQRYFSYRAAGGTCGRHAAIAVNTGGAESNIEGREHE